MTPLALAAITNFILAAEVFFLTGFLFGRGPAPRSAAWFWALALVFVGLSALSGGVDHGFFEINGDTPVRNVLEHSNWLLIGLVTFWVFLTTAYQFFADPWRTRLLWLAGLQLVVYVVLSILIDNFLVVIFNYVPVIVFLMLMNLRGLKDGTGTWVMVVGVVLSLIASGLQAAGVDLFTPFDRNSLYHFGMMAAVFCFWRGGIKLKGM